MKQKNLLLFLFLSLLFATPAGAQDFYASGNLGFGIRSDATDTGGGGGRFINDPAFVIQGAVGTHLDPSIRVEGEVAFHHNTAEIPPFIDQFTFQVISFMGNGYLDLPTRSPVKPYLGAGVGFALSQLEDDIFGATVSDTDVVLAFQLMIGMNFEIFPGITTTVGYRYFTTSDPGYNLGGTLIEVDYTSHDVLFGARFYF
ncbi:MAG: outer membrane beta-barrel protein [Nitrospinaceae bacterium]|nr:porin family protein [Nitrospinaceae bacterium]NIR55880.1 porin family protein [Nitrospinaceae bacterium]NIS86332.1 porin family protein [Nitrospinaceae bacterium]NIT83162.1 porin family protein [Nitrospinaceae bacterium]NIU45371.1 porin family protein [Nitrospinaceae bacterium]